MQEDGPVQGRAANDKTKKANELVRIDGQMTKEGDIVVASDSKSKLWGDLSWKRAKQNWNVKYVDVAITSSERLANARSCGKVQCLSS